MHSPFVILLINKLSTISLSDFFVNAVPSNHRIIGEVTTYPLNKVLISMLICQIVNDVSIYWYIQYVTLYLPVKSYSQNKTHKNRPAQYENLTHKI